MTAEKITAPIVFDMFGQCAITVEQFQDGYRLSWNDYVVGQWVEEYPNLSITLARVAALAACGEDGWRAGFLHDGAAFATLAASFLGEVVK